MTSGTANLIINANRGFFGFAGPDKKGARAVCIRALTGQKIPVAKCGVHALWDAIHADLKTPTEINGRPACQAVREEYAINEISRIARGPL